MNARCHHFAVSFDSDSDDSDFANMPELLDKNSSAVSSDDNSTSSRPVARKKKVVLISNASDDNEFNVKAKDGAPMVCEIIVALQGRVDAARLFGDRLEQIIFKLGGTRSTWDPVPFRSAH